jgi:hypothetical protein
MQALSEAVFTPEACLLPRLLPVDNMEKFQPAQDYIHKTINTLEVGPSKVQLIGRIINIQNHRWRKSADFADKTARGFLKLIIRDDTGVIVVSS